MPRSLAASGRHTPAVPSFASPHPSIHSFISLLAPTPQPLSVGLSLLNHLQHPLCPPPPTSHLHCSPIASAAFAALGSLFPSAVHLLRQSPICFWYVASLPFPLSRRPRASSSHPNPKHLLARPTRPARVASSAPTHGELLMGRAAPGTLDAISRSALQFTRSRRLALFCSARSSKMIIGPSLSRQLPPDRISQQRVGDHPLATTPPRHCEPPSSSHDHPPILTPR
jgi:hypothetical protein